MRKVLLILFVFFGFMYSQNTNWSLGTAHSLSTEVKLNPTILTLPVETDNFDSEIDDIVKKHKNSDFLES